MLGRSFARSGELQQPRAPLRLAVAQRFRLCWLGGLGKPESRQLQTSEDRFVFPDGHGPLVLAFRPTKTISTSCRRSSMRKWRKCTSMHSTVLAQEQEDYIGVKVEGPFKGGHYRYSDARFIRGCCRGQRFRCSTAMEKNRRGSRSGRTLRGSSSSARRPRHESSIAKNCLRSSSTWTGGVHRDKESLPNAKVQKPNWNTSARAHVATPEFPQILARGSEL